MRTKFILVGALLGVGFGTHGALWAQDVKAPGPKIEHRGIPAVQTPTHSPTAQRPIESVPETESEEAIRRPERVRYPFGGICLGEKVNVRSGPGMAYERLAQLKNGEVLTVVSGHADWYAVRTNTPLTTYVHADLVTITPSGVGMIARNRVNLRARASLQSTVLGQAQRGDPVVIRGRDGAFVAIDAPEDMLLYVHRDFIRRGTAAAAALLHLPVTAAKARGPSGPTAADLLVEARDLYLAELDKDDMTSMNFAPALERYERALATAKRAAATAAAEAGVRRVRIALRIQKDFRERMAELETAGSH